MPNYEQELCIYYHETALLRNVEQLAGQDTTRGWLFLIINNSCKDVLHLVYDVHNKLYMVVNVYRHQTCYLSISLCHDMALDLHYSRQLHG